MSEMQRPRGPKGLFCPFNGKEMYLVCETCGLWTLVIGTHPQNGEPINRWDCSFNQAVLMLAEGNKEVRGVGKELEVGRKAMVSLAKQNRPSVNNLKVLPDGSIAEVIEG